MLHIYYFETSPVPNISLLELAVVEAAHDFVPKIKNRLLQQNIQNSFDTWHDKKALYTTINVIININIS